LKDAAGPPSSPLKTGGVFLGGDDYGPGIPEGWYCTPHADAIEEVLTGHGMTSRPLIDANDAGAVAKW
jgi:hypothetical protein